ncbi:MAG: CehA/McbA family metallohydrolase [Lawsonibacter sp.]|nr:CehA/McbA family metallohydrolase [Lawsonibacter sp.]
MKKSYFPENGGWLKGNLHCHTTVSDGTIAPKELAGRYVSAGYDFLSMTDHNVFVTHGELPQEQILLLTGVEHDIEYSPDKCTHVVGTGAVGKESTNYLCKRYSAAELGDQQLIDMMRKDGQFVVLAHPIWSRMEPEDVLTLDGFHAMEIFNNGTEHLCHGGYAESYWDMLLRHGKRIFVTASDDVHVSGDLFGGWVWVKAAQRSPQAVIDALFHGAFYASSGPVIHDFGMDEDRAYVSCSNCREIHFVTYPPRGKSFFAETGASLAGASHTLTGREAYVRAVCVDTEGHSAWTNPIFFDDRK